MAKFLQLLLLTVLVLGTFSAKNILEPGYGVSLGSINKTDIAVEHHIVKRELIAISTVLGPTVAAAKALWERANAEERWAKIIINLTNFSKWRLTKPVFKKIKGTEVRDPLVSVKPDHTESFYYQQAAFASRTEGLMAWDVINGAVCIIYWYIQSDQSCTRHPNRLGLGCQENSNDASTVIDSIVENSSNAEKLLTLRYYKDGPYPMQFCHTQFCISGILGTGAKVIAEIDLFPKSLSDWNSATRDITDQEEIDSWILNEDESTKNHDPEPTVSVGNICMFVFASVGAILVLILLSILIYHKRNGRYPWQ